MTQKKRDMEKIGILAVSAAIIVVIVGFFLGIGFAGRNAYQAEEYQEAIAYLKWSPFFRSCYWDSYQKLGVQAAEAGDFTEAMDHLRMAQEHTQEAQSFVQGLQVLAEFSADGNVDDALHGAQTYFAQCGALPEAKPYNAVLTALRAGDYTAAAEGMLAEDSIDPVQWQRIFAAAAAGDVPQTVEAFLDQANAAALLHERVSGAAEIDMTQMVQAADAFAALTQDQVAPAFDSLDEVKQACGGTDGDILFVTQTRPYGAATPQYAVCTSLMSQLPAERIPEDMAQAEYVIVLSYDYQQTGKLDNQVTAMLREFGQVTAYHAGDWEVVYESMTIQGEEAAAMCYSSNPAPYLTGGSPKLGVMVRRALEEIMEE